MDKFIHYIPEEIIHYCVLASQEYFIGFWKCGFSETKVPRKREDLTELAYWDSSVLCSWSILRSKVRAANLSRVVWDRFSTRFFFETTHMS